MSIFQEDTLRGFNVAEVMSAFQKAVRRSQEAAAVAWAAELDQSGLGNILWSRIIVIASEDIGVAEPGIVSEIRALYDNYQMFAKRQNKHKPERLFVVHAAMLLARAKKSRRVDEAIFATYAIPEPMIKEIPDEAFDEHTIRGRKMGRGEEHFRLEAAKLVNEADLGPNPYYDRCWFMPDDAVHLQGMADKVQMKAKVELPDQEEMF